MYTQEDFTKDHTRFSLLMMFPPFAADDALLKAYSDEYNDIQVKSFYGRDEWPQLHESPFLAFERKYADQMEEADLYQKRYGTDFKEALDAYKKDK